MRCGIFSTLLYLCFAQQPHVYAQQQIFKNYTVNDGLASNTIRRVFQDSEGFLWIATWEGMSKYDGYAFTNYSTANGLSHNLVNDFYESADKQLYVALNSGNIDIITDNIISPKAVQPTVVVNRFIHAPGHPTIVVTDQKGMFTLEDKKLIHPKQHYPFESYSSLTWLNDSVFVATSENSIGVYNKNFDLITEIRDNNFKFLGAKIYQDSKKRLWAGTPTGLMQLGYYPWQSNAVTSITLSPPFNIPELQKGVVNDILEDNQGVMWFGTNGGLIKINPDGSHQLFTVKDGLPSSIIRTIFQDKEKNIWFGTAVGLSKLVTASGIQLYTLENGAAASDYLYLLYPYKKNHLLVSTQTSVQDFEKLSGEFTAIGSKGTPVFYSLVANTQTPVFVGLNELARLDTNTSHFIKITPLPIKLAVRIIRDKAGNLFVSNPSQLLFSAGNKKQLVLDYRISSLLIDKEGELWAGTWQSGLFHIRYRTENSTLQIISKEHVFPNESIRCLLEDSKGAIWVGTRYNGLYRLIKNSVGNTTVLHINQSKGLSSDFIREIKEDAQGNYWIAFYQGLDKLIPSGSGFHIFNFSRINNYFSSVVGMEMDADTSIWLATGEGLTHIKDGELEKTPPLPVYITKVFSPDSVYPLHTDKLQLSYRQNQLQFEFSAPGFINEKQVLYSYRLSHGSDTTWTNAGNQHVVSFASLQPGKYIFEVRSLGWNNEWGKPAAFSFIINPPFWQRWWFIFLCLASFVVISYLLIKKRIQSIQHEAAMKQRIAETEMMALRAQMNPHFIFNCLNSIDNLIQMNDKEKATSYLSKFAKLIRSILENSKTNIVPCWKDMETLQLYLELEALRFDNKFFYTVIMADELLQGDYSVPPLVIQPFVENAIHHGLLNKREQDKKLLVNVSVSGNYIHYSIEDNGVGRAKAASYKQLNKPGQQSMGLQITTDRINLFNQHTNGAVKITDLYTSSNQSAGTRVEVTLFIQP